MLALATLLLSSLAAAAPLDARAGGPAIKPIPSNCSITDPTLSLPPSSTGGYRVSDDFFAAHNVYYYYGTVNFTQCQEQCYGYGYYPNCTSVFAASNAPTPAGGWYGPGGYLEEGCMFFDALLSAEDFVEAKSGEYTDYKSADIVCPQ